MNTNETPNGGWQYYQSQTGWTAPGPVGHTFDQQVNNIIKHRKANMAIVAKHNLSLDPVKVGEELFNFQIARGAIKAPPKPVPLSLSPQAPGVIAGAVAVIKRMAAGAASINEWEELGYPHVDTETATGRALICSTCPKNRAGKSITDYFTHPITELYNKRFQKQQEMNLITPHDGMLNVCEACLCPMKNKVWFPNDLILKRLKPEHRSELDPRCWILKLS